MRETVIVLDFGGQYNQLIARRVREAHVYAELVPYNVDARHIQEKNPIGIIFTGGPKSVYEEGAPVCDEKILELDSHTRDLLWQSAYQPEAWWAC